MCGERVLSPLVLELRDHLLNSEHISVLSSNQLARRWRDNNPQYSNPSAGEDEERQWRTKCLEFLSAAHSLGGLAELSFEMVKSNYSVSISASVLQRLLMYDSVGSFFYFGERLVPVAMGDVCRRTKDVRRHPIQASHPPTHQHGASRLLLRRPAEHSVRARP